MTILEAFVLYAGLSWLLLMGAFEINDKQKSSEIDQALNVLEITLADSVCVADSARINKEFEAVYKVVGK